MKNEVFPKGFWVTFAKVTVREAKPAQSNEKHLFANAKSAIGRTFRKKRKKIRITIMFLRNICRLALSAEDIAERCFSIESAGLRFPKPSLFQKRHQNVLCDISYR